MIRVTIFLLFSLFIQLGLPVHSFGQSGLCDPTTPFYSVNLSGNPGGTWVSSPPVQRNGNCCNTTAPDKCIEFEVTLDSSAVAINFAIASGAVPPGAMYYQLSCGTPVPVGTPLCVSGPGPHVITFCKPGNNQNTYAITSLSAPVVSPDVTSSDGCNVSMGTVGIELTSITWTSVAPGTTGQYNSYLSCTSGCDTTIVTPSGTYPSYVDYQICGIPTAGACAASTYYCDTIRAYFIPPISNTITPNPAQFCANNPGVTITGTLNGGAPPYTITWYNGPGGTGTPVGTSLSYTAMTPGTYSMEVIDSTYPGCPAKYTDVVVTSTPVPIVNAGADFTACASAGGLPLNGSVINATGGVWSGGGGVFSPSNTDLNAFYTPSASEIAAGTVTLTLTSTGNGACLPESDQVTITIAPPMSVIIDPPVFCNGATATISAIVTGGNAPYTFLWNTGDTTQSLTGIPSGTYSVQVTDGSDVSCAYIETVNLVENPPLTLSVPANTIVSCDSLTVITVSASAGGGGPFSYQWSTGDTTNTVTVSPGTYTVTAADTFGCTITDTIVITSATISLTASVTEPGPICFGGTSSLTASAIGGFGNYTYLWSDGTTGPTLTSTAGYYCVTVSDSAGCLNTACGEITEHPQLSASVIGPSVVCNGATTNLYGVGSGGAPPYSVSWSTGATTNPVTVPAGTYSVTITDTSAAGCSATTSVTVTEPLPLSASFNVTDPSCFGFANGQVSAAVSGGIPPYSYYWPVSGSTSPNIFGLQAGTYAFHLTDSMGCTLITSVTVNQPSQVTVNLNPVTNATCFGYSDGTALANPSGGVGPYTYYWTPGGSTQQLGTGLPTGTAIVYVTDATGCAGSASTVISQPTQVVVSTPIVTHNQCYNDALGTATVSASGGSGGYSYLWVETGATSATATGLSMGTYNVTVTDLAGCTATTSATINHPTDLVTSLVSYSNLTCFNSNDGDLTVAVDSGGTPGYSFTWVPSVSTTSSATGLSAGTYSVYISDANGCTDTITQVLTEPQQLVFNSAAAIDATCDNVCNGQVLVIPGGGSPPYSYNWANGATTAAYVTACEGSYYVQVTDTAGCQIDTTLIVNDPGPINLTFQTDSAHCFLNDGSATVTASGGTPGYSYQWNTSPIQSGVTANNIPPGIYTVTVTDNNNCTQIDSVEVFNIPGVDSVSITFTPPDCYQGCDGTATATVYGGFPPYTYTWSNGGNSSGTTGLCAGTYYLTVTDFYGCTVSDSVLVTEPTLVTVTGGGSADTICVGESVTLTAAASGGSGSGFTYTWSNGMTGSPITVSPTAPTLYFVTANDGNGCSSVHDTVTVFVHSVIGSAIASGASICNGESALLSGAASGGNGNYSYLWSPGGQTTPDITVSPSTSTTYTLTITDNCGSPSSIASAYVNVNELPTVDFSAGSTTGCSPHCIQFSNLTTLGAGNVVDWRWDFGDGGSSTNQAPYYCYTETGNYTVSLTAESDSGCVSTFAYNGYIKILPDPIANFYYQPGDIVSSHPLVSFSENSWDAVSYHWDFGVPGSTHTSTERNPIFNYPFEGEFCPTLTVANAYGCEDSITRCLTVNPDWTFYVPNSFTPNDDTQNEIFTAVGHNIDQFEMFIYDRWGLMIYYTDDMSKGWNGTYMGENSPVDVYVYQIHFRDSRKRGHTRTGHVSLIR